MKSATMRPMLGTFVQAHPVLHAALLGWLGAAAADIHAFLGSHSWTEFWAAFDYKKATFRWLVGFLSGGAAALGWGLS